MKDLSLRERLERLVDWARQRNLLRPNETLFAKKQVEGATTNISAKSPPVRQANSRGCPNNVRLATAVKAIGTRTQ